jgi:hypothetical protein
MFEKLIKDMMANMSTWELANIQNNFHANDSIVADTSQTC